MDFTNVYHISNEELYKITEGGLKKSNDTFQHEQDQAFKPEITGYSKFLDRAYDIKEKSEDFEVNGFELKPIVDEQGIKLMVGDKPFHLTEWSLNQFASKVGVPAAYAIKMAKNGKYQLFLDNFRSWIDSHVAGKKFMVRTYGNHVRGVVSEKFEPVDNDFVLPLLRDGLQRTNMDFRMHKGILNPEFTNLRIVSNNRIDIGGDPHFAGVRFASSDVGRSALSVEFFVFRHACSNGMLFGKRGGTIIRRVHTNKEFRHEQQFIDTLAAELGRIDQLVEASREALSIANSKHLRDEDIQRIIDQFQNATSVGKKEIEFVEAQVKERMMRYSAHPTLFGVVNAFTELAQGYHVDKGEAMEDFAGNLLFKQTGVKVA